MRDMNSKQDYQKSLEAGLQTAAVNGASVNLSGYEGAELVADLGIFAGTTPTATLQAEESDDNFVFTVIAAADLSGGLQPTQLTDTNDQRVIRSGYIGTKQYIRWAITAMAGTAPSLPISAGVIRGLPRHAPVANQT